MLNKNILPDPEIIPEANLGRDNTFLTAMNVENNDILQTSGQNRMKRPDSGYMKTSSVMKGFESKLSQGSNRSRKEESPTMTMSPNKSY